MSPRFVEIEKYGYHGNVTWRLLLSIGSGSVEGSPPETLTRNVSSSLGSLTVTAFPLIASFRVCSSVGDVELVDSKATDGLLRILACPFLDIGARCFRLVWGDRWTRFIPLSCCSFDSESSELLFSNKKKVNNESSSYSENCWIKSQPATVRFENRDFRKGFQYFSISFSATQATFSSSGSSLS